MTAEIAGLKAQLEKEKKRKAASSGEAEYRSEGQI
jgi:hypothetical protein